MRTHISVEITLNFGVMPAVLDLARILKGGMSEADVQTVTDRIAAQSAKLRGIAEPPVSPPVP